MSSSSDVHTPRPFKLNGLWQFFPEVAHKEGDPDPAPFGTFKVLGDFMLKVEGSSEQRFLLLRPTSGLSLPSYETYAVEYPEKLFAGDRVDFERKRRASRIRVHLTGNGLGFLLLKDTRLPVRKYVLYEQQVEGTWIPIEADGKELRP